MDVSTRSVQPVEETNQTAPATAPELRERVPLGDVLRQIKQDAANEPTVYLTETLVPRGGE
jgi:hypothetical protein